MHKLFHSYNFCGLPEKFSNKENSRFHILPIPYEATTTYGHGTSMGPKAIIDASLNMETYDEELQTETFKLGIHTLPFIEPASTSPKQMIDSLSNIEINKNKILFSLGGEHSLSLGLIRAHKKKYPNISVLHFDAHADQRELYQGTPYSHACISRRVVELNIPIVSCGIRSLSKEEADFIEDEKLNIYWGKSALGKIPEIKSVLSNDIYITLDVDVLDPSVIPSTGTPEPDGWSWRELCNFLKEIIFTKNVIGFDIVELAPIPGISAPDFSIAKLIYRLMGYTALSKDWLKGGKRNADTVCA